MMPRLLTLASCPDAGVKSLGIVAPYLMHVMSNFCPPLGSIIDEESMEYDFLDLMGVKNG